MSKRILSLWLMGWFCFILSACQTASSPEINNKVEKAPVAVDPEMTAEQRKVAAEQFKREEELNEKAIITAKVGDADKAIELFQQLIQQNPKYPFAFTNLALQLLKTGNIIGARALFVKAIEHDNEDAFAYNHLALLQRREGLFEQAKQNYMNAIKADESYANAHLNLGILLDIYLQDLPEALNQYQAYQKLITKDEEITKNQDNKKNEEANELVEKWIVDIRRRIDSAEGARND